MDFQTLSTLYHQTLFDLISQSREVHLRRWRGEQLQRCSLLSIKTGGCSENCAYCAQSSHYATGLEREELLPVDDILSAAHRARAEGATRFCMGAAWRGVRDGTPKFEQVLETVREVSRLGMEVCVTLGQIGPAEARKLKAAGVTAYNHNIDTSPEFYPEIVSTHTFADRLNTIAAVQEFAGTMRSKPAAFSLLELVIAIAILATLLLPVISTLRARAQRAQCAANLRNLYVAANLYLQEKGKLAADPADERRRFGFAGLRETMDRSAQALWRYREDMDLPNRSESDGK
jgi:prepilin-type N-terminal cleavage/methylation domain-containing protein